VPKALDPNDCSAGYTDSDLPDGFVSISFENGDDLPASQSVVLLTQCERTVTINSSGVHKLPSQGVWDVQSVQARDRSGNRIEPVAATTTVTATSELTSGGPASSDARVSVDYSERVSELKVQVVNILPSDVAGQVTLSTMTTSEFSLEGYPAIEIPTTRELNMSAGDYVLISEDVPGFPNGFVGRALVVEESFVVLEFVDPLTVYGEIKYSAPLVYEDEVPLQSRSSFANAPHLQSRAGGDIIAKCDPAMRASMSLFRPDLEIEDFSISPSLPLKSESFLTVAGECQLGIEVSIPLPLGFQSNSQIYSFFEVSATGGLELEDFEVEIAPTIGVTSKSSTTLGSQVSLSNFSGVGTAQVEGGVAGSAGIQWPAGIDVPGFTAEVAGELKLTVTVDLLGFSTSTSLPSCVLQRNASLSGDVKVLAKAGLSVKAFGVDLGPSYERTLITVSLGEINFGEPTCLFTFTPTEPTATFTAVDAKLSATGVTLGGAFLCLRACLIFF
jgi:hypothetical protein